MILFFTALISCKQNKKLEIIKSIPEDEILSLKYEVLNQLIKEDSIASHFNNFVYSKGTLPVTIINDIDEERPLGLDLKYDSLFKAEDSSFYKTQEKTDYRFKLDSSKIHSKIQYVTAEELYNMRSNGVEKFWTNFNKRFEGKCVKVYSVPFFTKDKTICVVQNSTSCGILAADGSTAIYKKVDGKWIIIRSYDHWVS
ncbi:hypothetical protein ASG31_07660 [Chryseobacterium sp. Leaf404]|nr:hypothetical protein ASG31_07660 [Chryseobacterium sp. Leaf404]